MKICTAALAFTLICIATPTMAREHFQPYEGRESLQEGQGGTRINKNGIDYWTSGAPPRRYQILGLMIDKRAMGRIAGDAVGSPSVAQAVKDAGGDAVIILGEQDKVQGAFGSAFASGGRNFGTGFGWTAPFGDRDTAMQVIKYLSDAPAASPQTLPVPFARPSATTAK